MAISKIDRAARANLFALAAVHLETRQEEMTDAEFDNAKYVIETLRALAARWAKS